MQIDVWTWVLSLVKVILDAFEGDRDLTEKEVAGVKSAMKNNPSLFMAFAMGEDISPFEGEQEAAEKAYDKASKVVTDLEAKLQAARQVLREAKKAKDAGGLRNAAVRQAVREAVELANGKKRVNAYFPWSLFGIETKRVPEKRGKKPATGTTETTENEAK